MDQDPSQDRPPVQPADETPPAAQPAQPTGPYSPPGYVPPPAGYVPGGQGAAPQSGAPAGPGYVPPQQGYVPPGGQPGNYPPQAGAPPGYPPQYTQQGPPPSGYPPANYPPQGAQPQGYGQPQSYGPPEARRGGMPAWAWILIGLVVLVIIGCAGIFATLYVLGQQVNSTFSRIGSQLGGESGLIESMEPMGAVLDFYAGLQSHDYERAHSYLGGDLAARYTADDLARLWQPLEEGGDEEGLGVVLGFPLVEEMDGSRATVTQTLTSAGGNAYTITLQLEKSGDTWKIVEAEPSLIPEL